MPRLEAGVSTAALPIPKLEFKEEEDAVELCTWVITAQPAVKEVAIWRMQQRWSCCHKRFTACPAR